MVNFGRRRCDFVVSVYFVHMRYLLTRMPENMLSEVGRPRVALEVQDPGVLFSCEGHALALRSPWLHQGPTGCWGKYLAAPSAVCGMAVEAHNRIGATFWLGFSCYFLSLRSGNESIVP